LISQDCFFEFSAVLGGLGIEIDGGMAHSANPTMFCGPRFWCVDLQVIFIPSRQRRTHIFQEKLGRWEAKRIKVMGMVEIQASSRMMSRFSSRVWCFVFTIGCALLGWFAGLGVVSVGAGIFAGNYFKAHNARLVDVIIALHIVGGVVGFITGLLVAVVVIDRIHGRQAKWKGSSLAQRVVGTSFRALSCFLSECWCLRTICWHTPSARRPHRMLPWELLARFS
jgi:hypothetical protein